MRHLGIFASSISKLPTLVSATIEDATPTDIVMVFSEVVTGTNLGFTIGGTTSTTFASISGSGTNTITGVLAVAATNGETVTLSYNDAVGDIVNVNSEPLATFSSTSVTNNIGASSLLTDIVSYWKFDSASPNLDELGANTFTTSVNFSSITGKINQAEDGVASGYKSLATNGSLSFVSGGVDTAFSVSMWVKPLFVSGTLFLMTNRSASNAEWQILMIGTNIGLWCLSDNAANYIVNNIPTGGMSTGTWHHLVFTYDGSEADTGLNAYLDSVLTNNRSTTGTYTGMTEDAVTTNFVLNANWVFATGFRAAWDETGIWSKELTQSEVTELYNSGSGLTYPF